MKPVLAVFVGILAIVALMGLGVGLNWFGLATGRPMAQYAEDTRRLTFEHSRAHQAGTNKTLDAYCLNMRTATDPAQKKAFANFVTSEADNYDGPLTPQAGACVREAQEQ